MFKFLSLTMLLCTQIASSSKTDFSNVKSVIRGPTPPLENVRLFNRDYLFKDVSPAFLREAELKHGRIAMVVAILLPTLEKFTDGLSINLFKELPDVIQLGLVSLIFAGEFTTMVRGWENPMKKPFTLKDDYQPGDLGFGLWNINDPLTGKQMDKELNNGRLAMIAALGMICQELATGQQLF